MERRKKMKEILDKIDNFNLDISNVIKLKKTEKVFHVVFDRLDHQNKNKKMSEISKNDCQLINQINCGRDKFQENKQEKMLNLSMLTKMCESSLQNCCSLTN